MRTLPLASLALSLVLAACSGGGGQGAGPTIEIGPEPDPVTRAVLAGPLCDTDRCQCRATNVGGDGGAGVPETAEGEVVKRYEFHLGPAENGLWVMVDDNVLYKSDQRAEDCFYVDLRPGQHKVMLRASRGGGFSAAFDVHEFGPTSGSWYDTFTFNCGSPGVCAYDDLDAWKASLAKYTRSLHDACGSTKIKGVTWQAGRAADQQHPQDLQLELTLDVYQFDPELPSGHAECKDRISE